MPTKTTAKKRKAPSRPRARKTVSKPSLGITPPARPARTPDKPKSTKRTYLYAVGRRKSAVARVRFQANDGGAFTVNGLPVEQYFPQVELQQIATSPLETIARSVAGSFSIRTHGGGKRGQADAIRLGVARALVTHDPALRPTIKHAGHLTRDPRVKERKKYGLKRARRAPQWQKR
ncbi:MAG: 30S ribosomal protein S9 [Candidatus Kerfeldbacteria bacterium]|nr:30S ribosomal protein S9 [Candidatus Kerfeldbacteria bacterium]